VSLEEALELSIEPYAERAIRTYPERVKQEAKNSLRNNFPIWLLRQDWRYGN
jgi:hypothetical protein